MTLLSEDGEKLRDSREEGAHGKILWCPFPGRQTAVEHAGLCVTKDVEHEESRQREALEIPERSKV